MDVGDHNSSVLLELSKLLEIPVAELRPEIVLHKDLKLDEQEISDVLKHLKEKFEITVPKGTKLGDVKISMLMEETRPKPKKMLLPLILAVFIDLLGFGIILPTLSYLVEDFPISEQATRLGAILSIYSLAQFIFSPIWGRISDRYGRRPVILIGITGSVFAFLLFGLTDDYSVILFSRALAGFFTAATLPTARAYIADVTPPEGRAKYFGMLGAAFGLGFTLGPAIGGGLAAIPFPMPLNFLPALFASLLSLINLYVAFRNLPESLNPDDVKPRIGVLKSVQNFFGLLLYPGVAALIVIFGLNTFTFSGFEAVVQLFITDVLLPGADPGVIGLFFLYVGFWGIIIQGGLIGPIVKRLGEERTILIGLLFLSSGFFFAVQLSSNIFLFSVAVAPLAIGIGMVNPPLNSALSKRIPKDSQGEGLGINSSIGALGRIFGPVTGGAIIDSFGFDTGFYAAAVAIFLIAVFTLFSVKPNQVIEVNN